jgi:hypothetical protein
LKAQASMTDWSGQQLHPGSDGRVIALGDARLLQEAVHVFKAETQRHCPGRPEPHPEAYATT